ncbi:MAG: hypothetical protein ABL995_04390 [Bryobacteraceae bacterium]
MIKHFLLWAIVFSAPAASAAEPGSITPLVEMTGQRVRQFWDEFSSVASTETVLREKLDDKGKVTLSSRALYDYIIFLHWDNEGMLVDESRLPMGEPQKKAPQGALLTTQGFATLLMVFHPDFQSSYTYSAGDYDGNLVRVHFLPKKGTPTPAVLALKGRDFPITWEGDAWINVAERMVTRMEAHWRGVPEEIGLQELRSEVTYAPTQFQGGRQSFWLPQVARIEMKTLHQHWRNTHQFNAYRLFAVDSKEKIEAIGPEKKTDKK